MMPEPWMSSESVWISIFTTLGSTFLAICSIDGVAGAGGVITVLAGLEAGVWWLCNDVATLAPTAPPMPAIMIAAATVAIVIRVRERLQDFEIGELLRSRACAEMLLSVMV